MDDVWESQQDETAEMTEDSWESEESDEMVAPAFEMREMRNNPEPLIG